MSTPNLPTEIWTYIFSFACMDDGSTGCTLQRVSKHFRALSQYSRFTSVCLYRPKDILLFQATITPLPPDERRVRYLHITSPHLFLDVSEDELDDDGDYEISGSQSPSFDNEDSFPTEGNPGDEAETENVEMDIDESDSNDDEYRPLSPAEESEVHDDVAYFVSSATSSGVVTSQLFQGEDSMSEYMIKMDQAKSVILSSVKQIISTLSSTLYALSIHWTKLFREGYLSIPNFIPSCTSLPCLTELYLCVNIRGSTHQINFPGMFCHGDFFLEEFNGLTFPALRRLRFAGLAWSAAESPYNMIKRMAPNLTHVRTKTGLMSGALGPFTFPTNLKVLIEVPDRTWMGGDAESLMNDPDFVRSLGYDLQFVTVVGGRITDTYDTDCWEAHWAAALRGEAGHWAEPEDLILSSRE